MTPTGHETVYVRLLVAKRKILAAIQLYFPVIPDTNQIRDAILTARHAAGDTLSALAREFGLTPQRVFQIVNLND